MPINDEQAKQIKEQILKQVENLPEEKRAEIKSYIEPMSNQELEEFLIKNKMIRQEGESESSEDSAGENSSGLGKECIMCALANKKISSLAIYEDKDYLAALEINPFTKGHTILIPKQHLEETKQIKNKALTLANRIGKHIVSKLEAESYEINTSAELKHAIINIIPKYKGEKLDYQRKPAKKEELTEIASKIGTIKPRISKPREKKPKGEKNNKEEKEVSKKSLPSMNRRIP
ncbi:HIT family protein [Candidatus Pacearchaeota archaeon]|nr:HIT family protein [Candidatus Pacearchaeota archaeon]